MMFAQLCESSKSTELYTLKEWVFKLYVNEAVFFLNHLGCSVGNGLCHGIYGQGRKKDDLD